MADFYNNDDDYDNEDYEEVDNDNDNDNDNDDEEEEEEEEEYLFEYEYLISAHSTYPEDEIIQPIENTSLYFVARPGQMIQTITRFFSKVKEDDNGNKYFVGKNKEWLYFDNYDLDEETQSTNEMHICYDQWLTPDSYDTNEDETCGLYCQSTSDGEIDIASDCHSESLNKLHYERIPCLLSTVIQEIHDYVSKEFEENDFRSEGYTGFKINIFCEICRGDDDARMNQQI